MAHFQEPRSPRALRSPPASPAKPAESPTSPTARKTAKRSLGETSPGGSRPPRPKRVNSYSELNFSSIVRVDSLGTMALPAFGEGGSASEDENSKRRRARARRSASTSTRRKSMIVRPSSGRTRRRARRAGDRRGVRVAAHAPASHTQPRGASPGVVTASPGPTPPPPSRPSVRHNARSFAELGEEEVVREEEPWVAPEPQPQPSPPIAIGQPAPQTRASPPIADRAARPAVAAFATAGAVGRAALPHGPPGLRREPGPGRLLAGRAAGFGVAAHTHLLVPGTRHHHHLILPVRMAPHPELKPLITRPSSPCRGGGVGESTREE